MEATTRIRQSRKPKKCPQCGHAPLASILYGNVRFSDDLERELEKGTIVLGGCLIGMDDPAWACTKCGLRIYRESIFGSYEKIKAELDAIEAKKRLLE